MTASLAFFGALGIASAFVAFWVNRRLFGAVRARGPRGSAHPGR